MTIRQAGEVFGMAPATVHRRYEEALQQLRQIFTPKSSLEGISVNVANRQHQEPLDHE